MSRSARQQRTRQRQAEAARANGWQGLSCDHYLRLSCSRLLQYRFDNSIPDGETRSSWLREILVPLMRAKGLRTWALNELVAVETWGESEAVAPGCQALRGRIPSLLWNSIGQRAKREKAIPATWLRKMIYRAISTTEHWFPQTEEQRFALEYAALRAAGRADPYFHNVAHRLEPYKPGYHPLHVQDRRRAVPEHLLAARPPVLRYQDDPEAHNVHIEGHVQFIIDRCTERPPLDRCTKRPRLPPDAPQPKSPKEWVAAAKMMKLPLIWVEWSASDRDKTVALQDQGRLYQEMLRAEQNSAQVERKFLVRGMVSDRVRRQTWRDGLLWASIADQ